MGRASRLWFGTTAAYVSDALAWLDGMPIANSLLDDLAHQTDVTNPD